MFICLVPRELYVLCVWRMIQDSCSVTDDSDHSHDKRSGYDSTVSSDWGNFPSSDESQKDGYLSSDTEEERRKRKEYQKEWLAKQRVRSFWIKFISII